MAHLSVFLALVCTQAPGASDATPRSWVSAVREEIRLGEYHFGPAEDGRWSAPNRAQDLRARVGLEGTRIRPRDAGEEPEWELTLVTRAFGRSGSVSEVSTRSLSAERGRLEIDHGELVEWIVNDERGLEQGWTIATPPAGTGPVEIVVAVDGGLTLRVDGGRRDGVFVDRGGRTRLHYRDLVAWDANGLELDAELRASATSIRVIVDDANATYPVTVDPLMAASAWTGESDQAGAEFGTSVAGAGDVNGDGFDDVIVGATEYDNGETNEGRVFVYHGSASGLSTTADWFAEPDQAQARMGISVSSAGDVNGDGFDDVIVGAHTHGSGRAWVYHGSAMGLSTTHAWTAEPEPNSNYGESVSTAGDVNGDGFDDIIVGARRATNGQSQEGRAFVYLGSAGGVSSTPVWMAESNQAEAYFGFCVSTAGDVNGDGFDDIIVSAYYFDNGETNEGRVYVFHGTSTGVEATEAWCTEANQATAYYGISVSDAGDVNGDGYGDVIIGAHFYTNGENREGVAFAYNGSASGLGLTPSWIGEENQGAASFGRSVSSAGDVNGDGYDDVVVGAYTYDNGEPEEGRAYAYHGSALGLSTTNAWHAEANQSSVMSGMSIGNAGDVNGDGYDDVIVGGGLYDAGQTDEGRAWVYHGAPDGPVAGTSTPYNPGGANPSILTNVSTAAGAKSDAPNIGDAWRVSLDCSGASPGSLALFRLAFVAPPPPISSKWGQILIAIQGGSGFNSAPMSHGGGSVTMSGTIPVLPVGTTFWVQGFCGSAPLGFLSNALVETIGDC